MLRKAFLLSQLILAMTILIAANIFALQESSRSGVVELGPPTVAPPVVTGVEGVGPNVNVTQNARPQNETSIAADPGNPDNLVGGTNDYRYGDGDAGFAYSFDGGATWKSDTLDGYDPSLGKYDAQGDPAIAAHREGVFYFAFIDFNRGDDQNRLAVAKSTDGGVNWPVLGVIADHSGPGGHDFEDKEYIAVDNTGSPFDGNVYVSWTRFPVGAPTRIMFSRSTDGGYSYSTPMQISDSTLGYQGSVPAVGPKGEIYVAWWRGYDRIEIDKSTDGGVTWGEDIVVANIDTIPSPLPGAAFRVNSFPTIAVDTTGGEHNGNVYVAWADEGGGDGNDGTPNIMFTRSTDGGVTWNPPIIVSDDVNQTYQWFPWMSVDPKGNIDIVFYDRRDEPASPLFHTYYAQSKDGGLSFGPNVRVTDQISNSKNDGFNGAFIGDYNGICSTPNTAHPYWTDVRDANKNAEGYTAAITEEAPPPEIDIEAVPNPAKIGSPLKVLLDLNNPGDAFNAKVGLWAIAGSVIPLVSVGPVPIPAGYSITDYLLFSVASLPKVPPTIAFICVLFDNDTGVLLDWDVEVVGVTTAPSVAAKAEMKRKAEEFVKTLTMANVEKMEPVSLDANAAPYISFTTGRLLYRPAPKVTALGSAYPAFANPEAWIPYQLASQADVSIKIYNASGKLVRVIDIGQREAGYYLNKGEAAYWDGRSEMGERVSSGIYFYTLSAGDFVATKKLVILK